VRALALLLLLTGCPALRSPEERARIAVGHLEHEGYRHTLQDGGGIAVAPGDFHLKEPTVIPGDLGGLAVFGQVSADGRLDGTPFSYLGTERMTVRCSGGDCQVADDPTPRLSGVLAALRARSAAAPSAWFIRVDRDQAIVGEADATGVQRRRELQERDGRWVFTSEGP
jgi:hypothetical protein